MKFVFNSMLDQQIRMSRNQEHLRCVSVQHPTVGKRICSHRTGDIYTIQHSKKMFHNGWWVELFCENLNGNMHRIAWNNISCLDEDISYMIIDNNYAYYIID